MTLNLELTGINKLSQKLVAYVEGSEAGPIVTRKSGNLLSLKITCSNKAILNIRIYKENFEAPDPSLLVGEVDFSANRFVLQNRDNPKLHNKEAIVYETQIFDKKEKPVGTLTFSITYNKSQRYCGEKLGNLEAIPQRQPVTFYQGLCETKNLFSYFDSGNQDNKFEWCETNYRDETWGSR